MIFKIHEIVVQHKCCHDLYKNQVIKLKNKQCSKKASKASRESTVSQEGSNVTWKACCGINNLL